MKSAYEIAMERINQSAPPTKVSAVQKQKLAELDQVFKAKIAEREIFLEGEIVKATSSGDFEAIQQLNRQLVSDRQSLKEELETKKERVRNEGADSPPSQD